MDLPNVILRKDADGAVLADDWVVWLWGIGYCIPSGTVTDGASIPRFLWRICGHPLQVPRIYAALVHDWFYDGCSGDVFSMGVGRDAADRVYRDMLIELGWGKFRAYVEYYALRLFGGSHWRTCI